MSDDASAAVPVSALEALAGAWDDSAASLNESAARAAGRGASYERTESMAAQAGAISDCSRQLREAVARSVQG